MDFHVSTQSHVSIIMLNHRRLAQETKKGPQIMCLIYTCHHINVGRMFVGPTFLFHIMQIKQFVPPNIDVKIPFSPLKYCFTNSLSATKKFENKSLYTTQCENFDFRHLQAIA